MIWSGLEFIPDGSRYQQAAAPIEIFLTEGRGTVVTGVLKEVLLK